MTENTGFRSGFAALVGRPNVGKSTLLNALLGEKVSIVSSHAQTTRNKITGVWNGDNAQVVFLDTPGRIIHNPKAVLDLCAGCPRQGGQLACNALLYAGAGSGDRHSDQKCKDDGQDGPDDDRQLRSQFQFPKQHRFPHSVSLQNAALWA